MISKIDRKRVLIFVGIVYALSIAVALAISFTGGLFSTYAIKYTPLANGLLSLSMFAPAVANLVTRGITREGRSNLLLQPNLRLGSGRYGSVRN